MPALSSAAGAERLLTAPCLLLVQGCALWHNWWPMLTAFVYVLVPMPGA